MPANENESPNIKPSSRSYRCSSNTYVSPSTSPTELRCYKDTGIDGVFESDPYLIVVVAGSLTLAVCEDACSNMADCTSIQHRSDTNKCKLLRTTSADTAAMDTLLMSKVYQLEFCMYDRLFSAACPVAQVSGFGGPGHSRGAPLTHSFTRLLAYIISLCDTMCMIRCCELLQAARSNGRLGGDRGASARCFKAPSPL